MECQALGQLFEGVEDTLAQGNSPERASLLAVILQLPIGIDAAHIQQPLLLVEVTAF